MFIPIGDDVQKRTLPIIGIILIAINALVFIYSERLFHDSLPAELDYEGVVAWMQT